MQPEDKSFFDSLRAKIYTATRRDREAQTSSILSRLDSLLSKRTIDVRFDGIDTAAIKGDRGEKGDKGDTPVKGVDYVDGVDGKDGLNGLDGEQGLPGIDGKDGTPGEKGERGSNGKDGADGKDGEDGKDADIGAVQEMVSFLPRSLSALYDVNIGTPTNSQALVFDSTLNKWKPGTVASGITIGNSVTSGTAKSVLYVNASGNLAQDNPGFTYTEASDFLALGDGGPLQTALSGISGYMTTAVGQSGFIAYSTGAGGDAGLFYGIRSRGTAASPLVTQTGDVLFGFGGLGFTTANTLSGKPSVELIFKQDGASTASNAPGRINFVTNPGDGSNPTVASIRATGLFGFGGAAGNEVGQMHVQSSLTTTVTQILQAKASQTANLSEWRNSGGTALTEVLPDGRVRFFNSGVTFTGSDTTNIVTLPGTVTLSGTTQTYGMFSDSAAYVHTTNNNPRRNFVVSGTTRNSPGSGVTSLGTVSTFTDVSYTYADTNAVSMSFYAGVNITPDVETANGGTFDVSNVYAFLANRGYVGSGTTLANYYHFHAVGADFDGTVTNYYGLYIGTISGASTINRAIHTQSGSIVFNETGTDSDIRAEGDTDANLFFLDASTDRIGVGTSTPGSKLDVVGSFQCDSITNDTGLASGVYTPTRSAEANMDANVTMTEAQYMRVGNTVTVSGRFTADPTLTATTTSFEITLPVASNIGAAEDAAGVAFCGAIAGMGAAVIGVVANDTAKISWVSSDVTSQLWSYTFSYQVI